MIDILGVFSGRPAVNLYVASSSLAAGANKIKGPARLSWPLDTFKHRLSTQRKGRILLIRNEPQPGAYPLNSGWKWHQLALHQCELGQVYLNLELPQGR